MYAGGFGEVIQGKNGAGEIVSEPVTFKCGHPHENGVCSSGKGVVVASGGWIVIEPVEMADYIGRSSRVPQHSDSVHWGRELNHVDGAKAMTARAK